MRYHATHKRFTCHWLDSVIFNYIQHYIQELECGATMGDIWSGSIYQGIRDCIFNGNECLFAIRWISSFDEFFRFHRFANGRKWYESMYESDNPSVFEDNEISTKFVSWFIKRQKELSDNSFASALWLNYARIILLYNNLCKLKGQVTGH